jgi:AcrR family transcriptional regulator
MIDAVGENGYQATTVADVIKRAGVSRKTFYKHFADKQDGFLTTYDVVSAEGLRRVALAFHDAEGWPHRVEAAIGAMFESSVENPAAARLGFVEIAVAGEAGRERRERVMVEYERFIRDGLELAPGAGTIPEVILRAVVGGLERILQNRVRRGKHGDLINAR